MRIYLASDHAGFETKEYLEEKLKEDGYDVFDCGAKTYDEKDDYPDYISPLAKKVSEDKDARGVILGGSGQGEAIDANREKGVRAAVYYGGPLEIISLSREHNDANVLSLGARFLEKEEALSAVKVWLETQFGEDERHKRRIKKLDN